ncbi:hypothetical protein BDR03DRAFT_944361 [Suillus americanus]|nr:hypothetical protein BDR03DRAFT_944361 [Suillus americanus]
MQVPDAPSLVMTTLPAPPASAQIEHTNICVCYSMMPSLSKYRLKVLYFQVHIYYNHWKAVLSTRPSVECSKWDTRKVGMDDINAR